MTDRWSNARNRADEILSIRKERPHASNEADAKAENLRLILEIERQRHMERQTVALETLATTSVAILQTLQALTKSIDGTTFYAEAAADRDQLGLFDDDACCCGQPHKGVG